MYTLPRLLPSLLPLLLLALSACGHEPIEHEKVAGLSPQRVILSEGYSMLYVDVSKIEYLDLVLYIKKDSAEFDSIVKAVSTYSEGLKQQLETIARDYPGVRIDLKALPEMEVRKRAAIGKDRARQFAPFSGHKRVEFERTLLIGLSNGLNHESHLCRVMAEEETDPELKKFLLASEKQFAALVARSLDLLNREYFKSNANAGAAP